MKTNEKSKGRRIKTTLGVAGAIAGATLTGAALIGAAPQNPPRTSPYERHGLPVRDGQNNAEAAP